VRDSRGKRSAGYGGGRTVERVRGRGAVGGQKKDSGARGGENRKVKTGTKVVTRCFFFERKL